MSEVIEILVIAAYFLMLGNSAKINYYSGT